MNKLICICIILLICQSPIKSMDYTDWFYQTRYLQLEAVNNIRSQAGGTNVNELDIDITNENYAMLQIDSSYQSVWEYVEPNQSQYPGYAYFQHSTLVNAAQSAYPSAYYLDPLRTDIYNNFFNDILAGGAYYTYSSKTCSGTAEQIRRCKIYLTAMWSSATKITCYDEVHQNNNGDNDWMTILCYIKGAPLSNIGSQNPFTKGDPCTSCSSPYTNCRKNMCSDRDVTSVGIGDRLSWCKYTSTEFPSNTFCATYPGFYRYNCPAYCGDTHGHTCLDSVGYTCTNTYCSDDLYTQWRCPQTCGLNHGCVQATDLNIIYQYLLEYSLNAYRSKKGNTGTQMQKVYYSTSLEHVSQRISQACKFDGPVNDGIYRRKLFGYDIIAQTVSGPHIASTTLDSIFLDSFTTGKSQYTYSSNTCSNSSQAGPCYSFTVMNNEKMTDFACTKANCGVANSGFYLFCVYAGAKDYIVNGGPTYTPLTVDVTTAPHNSIPSSGPSGYHKGFWNWISNAKESLSAYVPTASTYSGCTDSDTTNCPTWAAAGLCYMYPGYYPQHCRKSCNFCLNDNNRINYCTYGQGYEDNKNFNCNTILTSDCGTDNYYKWLCPDKCDNYNSCM